MRYLLPFLAAALVLIVACTTPVTLDKPQVSAATVPADSGRTLHLSWDVVANAAGYNVYFNGATTKDTSITGTTITISTPYSKVEVEAYKGSDVSDKALVDCKGVTTASVTVYYTSYAGDTHHAFGFDANGNCVAYDLTATNSMDFVFEDVEVSTPPVVGLWSPDMYPTPYNAKDNGVAAAAGTDFDALKIAPTTEGNYVTRSAVVSNTIYPLWLDPTGNGWSTDDHFAKVHLTIDGSTVTMKAGYQKIGGLRWFVTQ